MSFLHTKSSEDSLSQQAKTPNSFNGLQQGPISSVLGSSGLRALAHAILSAENALSPDIGVALSLSVPSGLCSNFILSERSPLNTHRSVITFYPHLLELANYLTMICFPMVLITSRHTHSFIFTCDGLPIPH